MAGMHHEFPIEDLLERSTWLQGLARSLVGDASLADDLVQDACLAALERPPRSARAAGSWLRAVLRNGFRMHRRAEASRRKREERAARKERLTVTPSEALARAEIHQRIARYALELDEPFRTAILLRFFEGLAPPRIALETEAPVTTVRSRITTGLARLRARLDREHGGEREDWRIALLPIAGLAVLGGTPRIASAAGASSVFTAGAAGSASLLGGTLMAKTTFVCAAAGAAILAAGMGIGVRLSGSSDDRESLGRFQARHEQDLRRIADLEKDAAGARLRLEGALAAREEAVANKPVEKEVVLAPVESATGSDDGDELRRVLEDLEGKKLDRPTLEQIEATLEKHGRSPDHLLAAAELVEDPRVAKAYIEEALAKDGDSPAALLSLLNVQLRLGESGPALEDAIARLAAADPSSAFPQAISAYVKLGRGDLDGVLADMRDAAVKPRFNDYDARRYPTLVEFYGEAGHGPASSRALAAFGMRVEELPMLRDVVAGACDRAGELLAQGDLARALEYADAAADLGSKLSASGRTFLHEAVGVYMEQMALEREKAIRQAEGSSMAMVERRLAALDERRQRYKLMTGNCMPALGDMSVDDVSRYFDRLFSEGEPAVTSDLPKVREALREANR